MTIVFPATRPSDEAGCRLKAAPGASDCVRGIEHDQTSPRDAKAFPAIDPHGDGQLVHGSPQYDEKEEIDQRDERDAECHVEPTVGNELFEHRLDHSAATVYRTVPNATSSPATMVAALRRWPLTQVPLVLRRSIARQPADHPVPAGHDGARPRDRRAPDHCRPHGRQSPGLDRSNKWGTPGSIGSNLERPGQIPIGSTARCRRSGSAGKTPFRCHRSPPNTRIFHETNPNRADGR